MSTNTQISRKGKIIFLFAAIVLCYAGKVNAQDLWKVSPKQCVVLHDTLGVKMALITLAPGESLAPHTHSAFQSYVVDGGNLEVHISGNEPSKLTLPTGAHSQAPAMGIHTDKNVGTTTIKLLITEISHTKKGK